MDNYDIDYGIVDGKATHWITREGSRVAIRDMATSHISNTIAFLHRCMGTAEKVGLPIDDDEELQAILAGLNSEIQRREQDGKSFDELVGSQDALE